MEVCLNRYPILLIDCLLYLYIIGFNRHNKALCLSCSDVLSECRDNNSLFCNNCFFCRAYWSILWLWAKPVDTLRWISKVLNMIWLIIFFDTFVLVWLLIVFQRVPKHSNIVVVGCCYNSYRRIRRHGSTNSFREGFCVHNYTYITVSKFKNVIFRKTTGLIAFSYFFFHF